MQRHTVILMFSPQVIYVCVIQIPSFASQRANFSAVGLVTTPHRLEALDFLQDTELPGYTFLLKKTPANVKLKTLTHLTNMPDMHYGVKKGEFLEKYFKDSAADTPEARIWRVMTVSGVMLSKVWVSEVSHYDL